MNAEDQDRYDALTADLQARAAELYAAGLHEQAARAYYTARFAAGTED